MSGMDISTVFGLKKGCTSNVKDLVNLAKLAESAERFEDMCDIMAELVDSKCSADQSLTVEERNLLSVAYKNVVGSRRASLRNLMTEGETFSSSMMETFKGQIQKELKDICDTILDLLTLQLIKGCTAEVERLGDDRSDAVHDVMEAKVFYLKMGADYYRYLAECLEDDESKENAEEFYKKAYEIAEKNLEATHPIRLGLALNYSVCLYEIIKRQDQACDLAKKAFDEAISKLDRLQEADYKDSTLIMQLLRDNLTLWTAAEGDDDDDDRRR